MAVADDSDRACDACSGPGPIVYQLVRRLCGPCFQDFLLKKFMRAMRVANIRAGDRICLALSNGACAAVLADLFALSMRARDELHVTAVFVDFAPHTEIQPGPAQGGDWDLVRIAAPDCDLDDADARHEWRRAVVLSEVLAVARRTSGRVVLFGDCSDALAITMLACTAGGGRGFGAVDRCHSSSSMALEEGDDVTLARPLHLISRTEVDIFARYRRLRFLAEPCPTNGVVGATSDFLRHLQTAFPSCVSNILRTTDKLACDEHPQRCWACRDPIPSPATSFCAGCRRTGLDRLLGADPGSAVE